MLSVVSICPQWGGGGGGKEGGEAILGEGSSYVTITHDTLDLTVQGPSTLPPLDMETPLAPAPPHTSDIWWRPLETCSNLSSLYNPLPHWYWHLVETEACNVGKRAVCILLECFLVHIVRDRGVTVNGLAQ